MELIKREAAIATLEKHGVATDFGIHLLRNMPTIDAAPVVHGRWLWNQDHCKWSCSWCGGREGECETPICKWCGARMDGGEEHETD